MFIYSRFTNFYLSFFDYYLNVEKLVADFSVNFDLIYP